MNRIKIILGLFLLCMIFYYSYYYSQLGGVVGVNIRNIDISTIINEELISKDTTYNTASFEQEVYTSHYDRTYNNNHKINSDIQIKNKKSMDCIISIPDIDLKKIVYTGVHREKELASYNLITASDDMTYENGGNYIICGHNSRAYGHSLNRIDELEIGDVIFIYHNNNCYEYNVCSIDYYNMHQISSYLQQSNIKELTILTCSKNKNKEDYIIVKCQYKN